MPDFSATLNYLYGLQARGMKFGLENTRALLSSLGNPQKRLRTVHIAGTNGKGSTAALIAAVLNAAGYRTGLYTSPHLLRFTERIRVHGKEIDQEEVAEYVRLLKYRIEALQSTFFEVTTALALRYFADKDVDVAVIETGLGGRLDATNVLTPLLSIITSVGLDHTELLGNALRDIAREKGGIIKPGVPCLVGRVPANEMAVLRRIAGARKSKIVQSSSATHVGTVAGGLNGQVVDVRTKVSLLRNLFCSLPGDFQQDNIALAVLAIENLRRDGFGRLGEGAVRRGFSEVRRFSGLRGRLELIKKKPFVLVDVAHNPDAMRALVGSLRKLFHRRIVAAFGAMKDKDVREMARSLSRISRLTVAVSPSLDRAMNPRAIVEMFHGAGGKCVNGGSVRQGVRLALIEAGNDDVVVITGSHYVVGEFLSDKGGTIT